MPTITTSKREYRPNANTSLSESKTITDAAAAVTIVTIEVKAMQASSLAGMKAALQAAVDTLTEWQANPL
jgi:hypothetical protein